MRSPMFSLPTVVGLITVAFSKLGLTAGQGFLLLIATLFGSGVNIPVFRSERLVPDVRIRRVRMFNPYSPMEAQREAATLTNQVVAVNMGGCVIPVLLSLSLLSRSGFDFSILLCVAL
ncbi:Protein of unknown function DUF1614 like protein, partial [Aduncisulcus paluster]